MGVAYAGRRVMKRFKFAILPMVLVALCVAGCPPPDNGETEEKKPATPEEIRTEGQGIISDIDALSGLDPGKVQSAVQQLRTTMRSFRQEHGTTETGKQMIDQIASKLSRNANGLFERENYQGCLMACSLILDISPSHPRTLDLQRRAQEELQKPKVDLQAFFTVEQGPDEDTVIAFVKVTYRTTDLTESRKVKVGQEFDGYRFKKLIENSSGKPTGIVLRWLKTGKDVELTLHGP
jgi:hypothetical protein